MHKIISFVAIFLLYYNTEIKLTERWFMLKVIIPVVTVLIAAGTAGFYANAIKKIIPVFAAVRR